MEQQQTINDLIRRIYSAVIEPDEMPTLLEQLADTFSSHIVTNLEQETSSGKARTFQSLGFSQQSLQAYSDYYGPRSILFDNIRDYREGTVFVDQMTPNYKQYIASETYNDFHIKHQGEHGMCLLRGQNSDWLNYTVLRRSEKKGVYSQDEIDVANLLMPHLVQATKMTLELERRNSLSKSFEEAFNKLPVGVVLVNKTGQIFFANYVAEHIFSRGDGLSATQSHLTANRSKDNASLQGAITQAFELIRGDTVEPANAALIHCSQSMRPYQVSVMPLIQDVLPTHNSHELALVVINDPENKPLKNEQLIAKFYQLTLAEARVAQEFCNGLTITEIASLLNVSIHTIRFHTKNIFQKLHVKRQNEVVTLILNGPLSLFFRQ